MLPNSAERCGLRPANSHLRHGLSGIKQRHGDPIVLRIATACSPDDLERRHPHHAEAVTAQSGDDLQTMPRLSEPGRWLSESNISRCFRSRSQPKHEPKELLRPAFIHHRIKYQKQRCSYESADVPSRREYVQRNGGWYAIVHVGPV